MEFPLDMLTELHIADVWTKVPTYERDAVEVDYGRPERGTTTDPGRLAITINNRDGAFSPRNPMSPYYGLIGRNTRIRLSVPGEESFLQLDGDLASYASTPDTTALDLTMDVDLRWEGEADWYASGAQILIGKWDAATNQRSYHMRLQQGRIYFHGSADGVGGSSVFWTLPALPRRAALRSTLTGGTTVRHYWAESLSGPWTQIGTALDVNTPFTTGLFNGTAPLTIAPHQDDSDPPRRPVAGLVYRAEVRGAGDTVVASPDFTAQAAGTTAFTDSAGLSWTLTGAAEIRDRHDLFVGEVSEWPQHWTPDGADAWVPIVASGILRRMGQGKKALQSSLRRRIPSYEPMAYWPMEEGEQATKAYSPVPGIDPLSFSQANWAADTSLVSSAPLPAVDSQSGNLSHLSGMVRNYSWVSLAAWSVIWMYRMPQTPAARQTFMLVRSTGTVRDWYLQFGPADSRILGLDRDGATVVDRTIATGTNIFSQWIKARFAIDQQGSNIRYAMVWTDINGEAGFYENTVAGVTGRPTGVASPPGGYSANLQGLALGHISVWDSFDPDGYDNAINGWAGETAWERMRRLSDEEGLMLSTIPGDQTPELVGSQTTETLLTLLQEAADADGGLLLEDRRRLGLVFRQRSSMYSQTPRLVLSYDQAPGLAAPLEPIDDDTAIRNDRTVQRKGGGQARAVLEEGPLSVQEPPDGIGRYDDSVTLNLYSDDQTAPIAYWRLALGTVDGPRYPTVTVMLHKAPHLIPQILALTEGDLIRITDLPAYVGFGDANLIVDSVHHEMRLMQWTVTLNCQPAEPWQAGVTDDAVLGRVDTDGSELAAAVDTDDTTLSIATTDGPTWFTSPREYPFDLRMGGEVVRAVAAGLVVNENPLLTSDLSGWVGQSAAIDYDTSVVHSSLGAIASMRVTPGGASSASAAATPQSPVGSITPGASYTMCGWVYAPDGWPDMRIVTDWYNASNSYLSTSPSSAITVSAGQWTFISLTATAPANASRSSVRARIGASPTAADLSYWWAIRLIADSTVSASSPQTFTVIRSVNGVTKSHTAGTDVRLATPTRLAL